MMKASKAKKMIEAPSTVEFNSGELVIQQLKNTLMSNFSEKVTKTSIRASYTTT